MNQMRIKFCKNKKALSTIIATVILILLVTVATGIVWAFVKNIMDNRMKHTETCFGVESSEKVTLNDYYNCFNSTSKEVHFSVSIGDVNLDAIVVNILAEGNTKTFTLRNESAVIANLRYYPNGVEGQPIKAPEKNEGMTYIASGFSEIESIDWIKIAPIIDDEQCSVTDTATQIENCALLIN